MSALPKPEVDAEALGLQQLQALLQPLAASNELVGAYMRRMESLLQRRAELFRQLLALHREPCVALVDLEATCYRDREEARRLPREVIEIGLVVLDCGSLQVRERLQLYTRPSDPGSYVSDFCTELTGIRARQLDGAPDFAARMRELRALQVRHGWTVWASYGGFDPRQLAQQARLAGIEDPFAAWRHLDLRELAGAYFGFGRKPPGLARALALAGLAFDGRQHSGVDDAHNAARLLAALMQGAFSAPADGR